MLVVSINRSGNAGGIFHGVVITPLVIFFLRNLTFTKLVCLLMPGSEVVKKLRIGWVIELFKAMTVLINKSYQRLNGKDVITTPKTKRVIEL